MRERGQGVTFAVVFALVAAFSNAVNLMTQHSASVAAPKREKGWRLGLYLVRQPLWLLGGAAAVGSYAFQALALHNGPMSVVQPVLVTELVFVMVLRRVWIRQHVAPAAGQIVTDVGGPHPASPGSPPADWPIGRTHGSRWAGPSMRTRARLVDPGRLGQVAVRQIPALAGSDRTA
jgi:hypothetical protein